MEMRGEVLLNGREYSLREALFAMMARWNPVRCVDGLVAGAGQLHRGNRKWVLIRGSAWYKFAFRKKGHMQQRFTVGDELGWSLVCHRYEPGLIAHVYACPMLSRIVGGGQVKQQPEDFCRKKERVALHCATGRHAVPCFCGGAGREGWKLVHSIGSLMA